LKIEDKLFDLYITNTSDTWKCPWVGCHGAGTVEKKSCPDLVECEICGTSWKDPFHMSVFSWYASSLGWAFTFRGDTMSNIRKLMKGEPCPSCGIIIDKNGGCSHMQC